MRKTGGLSLIWMVTSAGSVKYLRSGSKAYIILKMPCPSAAALLYGCDPSVIESVLNKFTGLEHRLESVRDLDGVRYINDSKGTNVGAVVKSLESFNEPLLLIAGGRDKGSDFSPLRPLIKKIKN